MHTRSLLFDTLKLLYSAEIEVWVFGGWGEELRNIIPTRDHKDIDLLYPAQSFDRIDTFFRECPQVEEIVLKHFSHKRAAQYQGVMVEFFLVQLVGKDYITDFFDGQFRFTWPSDVFDDTVLVAEFGPIRTASCAALQAYRASRQR
jgi:hypothetical protein